MRRSVGRGRRERRVQGSRPRFVGRGQASALSPPPWRAVVFDLDGTLLDSDEALAAPFIALGVPREQVTFGHVVAEECARLGYTVDDYLSRYDASAALPFAGIDDMLRRLSVPWAVCSNKVRRYAEAELARLGWEPAVARFAEDFDGPKQLRPVLDALAVQGSEVLFVGDTDHDRACAKAVGARFALAAWNPRARRAARPDDTWLDEPGDLLRLFG